jgi:hypothetical protein
MERRNHADMCDQHAGGGRGDARHVVVLGVPHPAVPALLRAEPRPHPPRDALRHGGAPGDRGEGERDIGIVTEHCPSRKLPPPSSPPRHRSSTPDDSRTTSTSSMPGSSSRRHGSPSPCSSAPWSSSSPAPEVTDQSEPSPSARSRSASPSPSPSLSSRCTRAARPRPLRSVDWGYHPGRMRAAMAESATLKEVLM